MFTFEIFKTKVIDRDQPDFIVPALFCYFKQFAKRNLVHTQKKRELNSAKCFSSHISVYGSRIHFAELFVYLFKRKYLWAVIKKCASLEAKRESERERETIDFWPKRDNNNCMRSTQLRKNCLRYQCNQ